MFYTVQALNSSKKKDLKVLHFLKELLLFHNIIQIVGTLRIANWLNINKNDANYFLKLKKKLQRKKKKCKDTDCDKSFTGSYDNLYLASMLKSGV